MLLLFTLGLGDSLPTRWWEHRRERKFAFESVFPHRAEGQFMRGGNFFRIKCYFALCNNVYFVGPK